MMEWEIDVPLPAVPRTHVEENYTSFYMLNADGIAGNDMLLRLHPNGLCLVALAPTHAACRGGSGSGASAPGAAAAAAQEAQPDATEPGATGIPYNKADEEAAADSHVQQPEQQKQQQAQQPALAGNAAEQQQVAGAARLVLGQKLLQAEFRKGRGPLLQPDTVLGRLSAGGTEHVLRCGVKGLLVELNAELADMQGEQLLRALQERYLAILEPRPAEAAQLAVRCLSEEQYHQQQRQQQQLEAQQRQQQGALNVGQE